MSALPVLFAPGPVPAGVPRHAARATTAVEDPRSAEGLVWVGDDPDGLAEHAAASPDLRWVQLPWAGADSFLPALRSLPPSVVITTAHGILAEPVAEHALVLAAAARRGLDRSVRHRRWTPTEPRTLFDTEVTIVGGGEVARALIRLLTPWRARVTVVRRRPEPLSGAVAVVGPDGLRAAASACDVLVLAAPLTERTRNVVDAELLGSMRPGSCLVNVGRGGLVDTEALTAALAAGRPGAAALDVTEPEPLPSDHPLWSCDSCLITAHCAGEPSLHRADYGRLVADNAERLQAGRTLRGEVDIDAGY